MADPGHLSPTSRRRFLKTLALLGVAGRTLLRSGDARAAVTELRAALDAAERPPMTYRQLGRTGYRASRLVFGCGAALSRGPRPDLLDAAFDAGINVFDVGFRGYYKDAEENLAPFLKKRRDEVFLISKAIVDRDIGPKDPVSSAQAKEAAASWLGRMDDSLRELQVEQVDAYYLMASNNPELVTSDELFAAFEKAKAAGKVRFFGLSTHQNAQKVLSAAADSGRFDLAMIAITPAGWYDWADKTILPGSQPMAELQPVLAAARAKGMGLVGMKAGRYIAGRRFLGWGRPTAFDEYYGKDLMDSGLSAFQKSYAYVLAHGLDVVNADMQSLAHLDENIVAAATSSRYFA